MKTKPIIFMSIFVFVGLWTQHALGADKLPFAVISETEYRFASVLEGDDIVHNFVLQNTGDAPLSIEKVRTDCGCTAVSYPRQVPANGEGKITISIDTNNDGGRKIRRQVVVQTNDSKHPQYKLIVSGFVEKFAVIAPSLIKLKGTADQNIETSVTIIPGEKYPFRILDISAKKGDNIRFTFKEMHFKDRNQYVLMVNNIKSSKGRYVDKIYLKTDSTIRPVIEVVVVGIIS